jgi:hypothetical protein
MLPDGVLPPHNRVDAVLMPPSARLSSVLRQEGAWQEAYRDGHEDLFLRR